MKFIIARASQDNENVSPHPLAQRELITIRETRHTDVPNSRHNPTLDNWFLHGTNHHTIACSPKFCGVHKRDVQEFHWVIDITSLEMLCSIDERVIVYRSRDAANLPIIMIYDDYIE